MSRNKAKMKIVGPRSENAQTRLVISAGTQSLGRVIQLKAPTAISPWVFEDTQMVKKHLTDCLKVVEEKEEKGVRRRCY